MRPLMPLRRRSRLPVTRGFDGFENRMRRLFEEAFGEVEDIGWSPPVEVTESDDALQLTAELPGMKKEDVEIELEDDVLTLHGVKREEKEEETEEAGVTYRVSERSYGEFSRSFTVPSTVEADEIIAEFRDGVLTVTMPKAAEARGRKIRVEG